MCDHDVEGTGRSQENQAARRRFIGAVQAHAQQHDRDDDLAEVDEVAGALDAVFDEGQQEAQRDQRKFAALHPPDEIMMGVGHYQTLSKATRFTPPYSLKI